MSIKDRNNEIWFKHPIFYFIIIELEMSMGLKRMNLLNHPFLYELSYNAN